MTAGHRAALDAVGGFGFWRDAPVGTVGEDVIAEQRVMARYGGAGNLPSGAVHLESATTVPDRAVTADAPLRAAGPSKATRSARSARAPAG